MNSSLSCADYASSYSGFLAPPADGKPYVAIGYIDNFTSEFQSCCPSTVSNFAGVDKLPETCFYYCVIDGSKSEWQNASDCTKQKGEQKSNGRTLNITEVYPDNYKSAASWVGDKRMSTWGYVLLGVGFVGAVCGAL